MTTPIFIPCGHTFEETNWNWWRVLQNKRYCPVCGKKVYGNHYRVDEAMLKKI